MWWIYVLYFLNLAFRVAVSMFLGNLVDRLDKKTKISGAFIGGVLLAAVTSLPELFTSFSSVFLVNEPEYVVGDILGSIIFNLVVLGLETVLFRKNFFKAKLEKFHFYNGLTLLLRYLFAAYAFFVPVKYQVRLGDINLRSVLIFVLYILTLVFQPKSENKDDRQRETIKWSLKRIIVLFVLSSIALIGSSIARTYLTKGIQNELPILTGSVAGALLLGIGTSIPELISTAQLFRKKNYDAGYGNRIGSCTFDFAIFALADFLSWHQYNNHRDSNGNYIISQRGIFIASGDALQFEIYGIVVTLLILLLVGLKAFTNLFEKKKKTSFAITTRIAAISLACYLIIFLL